MTGYITPGTLGDTLLESQGTDAIPAGPGEVMGAALGQAFNQTTPALFGWINARTPSTQPRTLQADEANEMFGIDGHLRFAEPTTMDIARDRYDHERARLRREDAIRRASGEFGTGVVARFAAAAAGTLLDPLNVASAFIPFVGEANIARAFGVTGASALGRLGVRAAEGAGAGALGAAAIEPINLWLAREYEDDYTMGDAMLSLALGATVGSFLHSGLGVLRDARRGIPNWTPEANRAAMQQGAAALAEGRPVMAAETIEFTAARQARQELEDWYGKIRQVDQRAQQAEAAARTRTEAMTAAADELAVLRQEAAQLGREMRAVETLRATRSLDLPQRTRLTEIDANLADENTPLSDRLTMEIERLDLIDEAAGRGPRAARALDAERDDMQMTGLSRAAGRLRSKAALAENRLRKAQERLLQADDELKRVRGLQATREATVLAMADKTVRRLAFRLGIALEPGQSLELASQFIRTAGGDIEAALRRLQQDLGEAGRLGPGVDLGDLRTVANEQFSGPMRLMHGTQDTGPLPKFVRNFEGERYDMDGGTFGSEGVYLDATGLWNDGTMGRFSVRRTVQVEGVFDKAFLLTPRTVGRLAEIVGADAKTGAKLAALNDELEEITKKWRAEGTQGGLYARPDAARVQREIDALSRPMLGADVVEKLRAKGYDGIIVHGFGDGDDKAARPFVRNHLSSEMAQDQVFAFNPEKWKATREVPDVASFPRPNIPTETNAVVPGGLRISPDEDIMLNALRGLTEREARAATALRDGLRMTDDAADVQAARTTAAEIENAPKVEGTKADELAEAQATVKEMEDILAAEERQAAALAKAEGREPPKPNREIEAANEEAKVFESMAKAYEAAAICAIGRA